MWQFPTLGKDPALYWDLVIPALVLVTIIALGVWAIIRVKRWRQHNPSDLSPGEELSSYRQLLEQGLLAQEEFDRVRARLEPKGQLAPVPSPPAPGPAPPVSNSSPAEGP